MVKPKVFFRLGNLGDRGMLFWEWAGHNFGCEGVRMGRSGLTVQKRRVAEEWENNITSSGLWGLNDVFVR